MFDAIALRSLSWVLSRLVPVSGGLFSDQHSEMHCAIALSISISIHIQTDDGVNENLKVIDALAILASVCSGKTEFEHPDCYPP